MGQVCLYTSMTNKQVHIWTTYRPAVTSETASNTLHRLVKEGSLLHKTLSCSIRSAQTRFCSGGPIPLLIICFSGSVGSKSPVNLLGIHIMNSVGKVIAIKERSINTKGRTSQQLQRTAADENQP